MSGPAQAWLEAMIRPSDKRPHLGLRILGWRPPTINDRKKGGKLRKVLGRGTAEKQIAQTLVAGAEGRAESRKVWTPPERWACSITEWGYPGRDLDNVAGAYKYVIDALVREGWLPGDARKNFREFRQTHPEDGDVPAWVGNAKTHAASIVVWPVQGTEPLD